MRRPLLQKTRIVAIKVVEHPLSDISSPYVYPLSLFKESVNSHLIRFQSLNVCFRVWSRFLFCKWHSVDLALSIILVRLIRKWRSCSCTMCIVSSMRIFSREWPPSACLRETGLCQAVQSTSASRDDLEPLEQLAHRSEELMNESSDWLRSCFGQRAA